MLAAESPVTSESADNVDASAGVRTTEIRGFFDGMCSSPR
jgi:hypothetical protein